MGAQMLDSLRRRLEPAGLNLIGVAGVRDYDARVPAEARLRRRWPRARSAIVIGNGGPAYWRACRAFTGDAGEEHPLDRFAEHCFETLALEVLRPLAPVAVYPHRYPATPVSFVHLAECAGLGARSLLGVLIRPDYGTWFALRAAAVVEEEIEPSPRLDFDPCPPCSKPCVAACPGEAVQADGGWNVPACARHRLTRADCGDGCHSRLACVYGQEHAYPLAARRHHQAYARRAMAGIAEPGSGGQGPDAGAEERRDPRTSAVPRRPAAATRTRV